MSYDHKAIDKKWQERWESSKIFEAQNDSQKEKFYCLIEFPYPSGSGLHVGHVRSYAALDAVSRKKRMEGKNVLYPIGWDAFGLPTENYAIKTGRKPTDVTRENTDTFRRQLKALGLSFDWSREVNTTDPAYYKWTQWMFLEFFRAGLAYKAKTEINWCPKDKIGLANEEAAGGVCDRCGGPVEKREKEQWMIAITKYAERLLQDLDTVNYLPKIKKQQQDWIGKSEGAEIDFALVGIPGQEDGKHKVKVFTTRPDTIFGATFIVISPEVAKKWIDVGWQAGEEVRIYVQMALAKDDAARTADEKEKTGVDTGLKAINPVNGEQIPVWIGDFVLGHYGTGSIFADAHDERDFIFAKKYGIPLKVTIRPSDESLWESVKSLEQCYTGDGVHFDSDFLDGLHIAEAKTKVISWLEEKGAGARKTTYKLRDWVFSRQRYWGEPIPLVHCENGCAKETGGWVAIPDEQLPVTLPDVEAYQPTDSGESPLANITDWVNTTCPNCGGGAKRETDTMPNWAGSSWYFLRYVDARNDQKFASPEALKYWMPVDLYNGGMEHTTLHLLYSRFWNKFLFDRGYVPTSEPYARRHSHGLILGEDGTKMSKSVGNVVNPDEIVEAHGADVLRLYEMFMGPFEEPVPWNTNGVIGVRRFFERVMRMMDMIVDTEAESVTRSLHKTIKKVGDDIEGFRFNTAVSAMMTFVNDVYAAKGISKSSLRKFAQILCPMAPHIANELAEQLGETEVLETQPWPVFDLALVQDTEASIGVQVNGKVRATITIAPDMAEEDVIALARKDENVAKYLTTEPKKTIYVKGRLVSFVV